MADISDYFNNDIVHILKGFGSSKYFKRFSIISGKQNKFLVMSAVTADVFEHPEKYNNAGDVLNAIAEEITIRSLGIEGRGIGIVKETVGNRKVILDEQKSDSDEKKDLKEL